MITKETIISSAKELFLKYGVKSVSMDDISRMLGISKKTIYTYIATKKDLVSSVVTAFIDEEVKMTTEITKSSKNAIDEISSIAKYVLESLRAMKPSLVYDLQKYHPKAWKLVEGDHYDYIKNLIKKNIERGVKEGFYRDDTDSEVLSRMYIGLSRLMVNEEVFPTNQYDISYLYESFLMYHLNGIMNTKGRKELVKYINIKAA